MLSAQSEYSRIDNENFRILPLSFEDFCNNLSVYYESDRFIAKIRENQLPAANKEPVFISEAFAAELQDSFEVVYINVDKYEEMMRLRLQETIFIEAMVQLAGMV